MTAAQITAAAILRTRGAPTIPVSDRRGNRIGYVARNRYGLWECFRDGKHLPGSHLDARSAIETVRT